MKEMVSRKDVRDESTLRLGNDGCHKAECVCWHNRISVVQCGIKSCTVKRPRQNIGPESGRRAWANASFYSMDTFGKALELLPTACLIGGPSENRHAIMRASARVASADSLNVLTQQRLVASVRLSRFEIII